MSASVAESLPSSPIPAATMGGAAYRAPRGPSSELFDPNKHLAYEPPSERFSFEDLGFSNDLGIGSVALTLPFRLFSLDAIKELRQDILSDEVLDKYGVSSPRAAFQAREYNSKATPFNFSAWNHPEVLRCISDAAGVELVPVMPLEMGHTNYQVGPRGKDAIRELTEEPSQPWPPISAEERSKFEKEIENRSTLTWHYDSYPMVAVTMLSDVSTMVGGETALVQGNGAVRKVQGPSLGMTFLMQGRHLQHQACAAANSQERISMVTSFRAKDVTIKDLSHTDVIWDISHPARMNYQWTHYRSRFLAERFTRFADSLEAQREGLPEDASPRIVTKAQFRKFAEDQIAYLQHTWEQMMIEDSQERVDCQAA